MTTNKAGIRTNTAFDELFGEIYRRYPAAETFDPCPCGLTLVIIEPRHLKDWHFPIPDHDLRERARTILKNLADRGQRFTCVDGGLLVIAEVA